METPPGHPAETQFADGGDWNHDEDSDSDGGGGGGGFDDVPAFNDASGGGGVACDGDEDIRGNEDAPGSGAEFVSPTADDG